MSATNKTADFEVGAVAHVSFRVRCETLGYGEEIFLVAEGDHGRQKVSCFEVWILVNSLLRHPLRMIQDTNPRRIFRFLEDAC